jgi:hypothetical protein
MADVASRCQFCTVEVAPAVLLHQDLELVTDRSGDRPVTNKEVTNVWHCQGCHQVTSDLAPAEFDAAAWTGPRACPCGARSVFEPVAG